MTDAHIRAIEAKKLREVASFIHKFVGKHGHSWGIERDVWISLAEKKLALAEALEISIGLVPREVM